MTQPLKNLITLLLIGISITVYAQDKDEFVKKIAVQGSAEMEVIPDEIFVRITLKEYKDDRKTVQMDVLENQLVKAVRKIDIPEENFQVENIFGYNWDYRKKKSADFLASKSYRLKLADLNKMNDLLEMLDDKGIQQVNITEYSHSNIEEYRQKLKLEALRAAKEKAGFLLSGIDEKLGGVLEVHELGEGAPPYYPKAELFSNRAMDAAVADSYEIDFKTIKLRYTMDAIFAIQ